MEANEQNDKSISFNLTRSESLVFFEWIARFTAEENAKYFSHASEEQLLFNFEACLEKILIEPFEDNYLELVSDAQERVFPSEST